ncbi:hypothetical protein BKA62DRAFT_694696 [Auriculariales sp. MPI-PUGE-AT-0066]|nr:hypothetical protein BKA62DRAFT_694696 [Auriculariales sp. MPI-PUGE-AT-0066]
MRFAVNTPCSPASTLLKTHQGALASSASSSATAPESDLLRRGDAIDRRVSLAPNGAEEELAWSRTRVAVSVGPAIVRQYNFENENEEVQFACWGNLDYMRHTSPPTNAASEAATAASSRNPLPMSTLDPRAFGPFASAEREDARKPSRTGQSVNVRALFVFLRVTGRVFLDNGIDYVISLPFIVRRAWPMYPRGVILERAPTFRHPEAPWLFVLTDPLADILPIGKADIPNRSSVLGHRDFHPMLSGVERVVGIVERHPPLAFPIAVTINGRSKLTFWRIEGKYRPPTPARGNNSTTSQQAGPTTQSAFAPHLQPHLAPQNMAWSALSPRTDLSLAMDKMALAGRVERDIFNASLTSSDIQSGALVGKLYSCELPETNWIETGATTFLFDAQDHAWGFYCRIGVHFPSANALVSFELQQHFDGRYCVAQPQFTHARAAIPLNGLRPLSRDVLILKPDHSLAFLAFGLRELKLSLSANADDGMDTRGGNASRGSIVDRSKVVQLRDPAGPSFTTVLEDGTERRVTVHVETKDNLTRDCFAVLAFALTQQAAFDLYRGYISELNTDMASDDFESLRRAILRFLDDELAESAVVDCSAVESPWDALGTCLGFRNDVALANLVQPSLVQPKSRPIPAATERRTSHLAPMLFALHLLGEDYKLNVNKVRDLGRLAPLLVRLARGARPMWADHWARMCPHAPDGWRDTLSSGITDAIPHDPPDIFAHLRCRLLQEKYPQWPTLAMLPALFAYEASLEYGSARDPVRRSHEMLALYSLLTDPAERAVNARSEKAVMALLSCGWTLDTVAELPVGAATPIREALRRCQQSPPPDWPVEAYTFIGRDDLAKMAQTEPVGPRPAMVPKRRRRVQQVVDDMRAGILMDVRHSSGVDLDIGGFTEIRFGQDRRLQEVARILQSSGVPTVAMPNVAEISEHDLAREHQNLVLRVCERTLAIPLGRALFTFGTVSSVLRDAYAIPRMEYDVRVQPENTVITAEAGKITLESRAWAEFHNGVAAGLRISPNVEAIDSEWIVSNRPGDLTPQHAGFLFALGLTGHLKNLLTWHMFKYLTPKHDLTSVGILLGASAGHLGTRHDRLMALLSVHAPALLSDPKVDLNIPLIIQASGISGMGLVFMATRDRSKAEVALREIGYSRVMSPDSVQENRDAYSLSAGLAFGMIMLGTRSESLSPADQKYVQELRMYIQGLPPSTERSERPPFDQNVTAPVATIALALMFLKSERREAADIVALPTSVHGLDSIPPNLLLLRTLAKSVILWSEIRHSREWVHSQVPRDILQTIGKPHLMIKDSHELAYYHMVSGACFALGLRYAGSAREEAKETLLGFFDQFNKRAGETGGGFEQRIKRAAIQDGLNLMAISLALVMAGSGDIPCLRRFRVMHGQTSAKYGSHVAAHMAIGLLFLGGGKFTLGTSDCAIACLITAFFPRFPRSSHENVSYVQALRHIWVLALEPRCLISCDVDTNELVHLPFKLETSDGRSSTISEAISPALIPELDKIRTITVESDRYWPIVVDIAGNDHHRTALLRTQTIFVKRKAGFLTYDANSKGSKGIVLRPGSSNAAVISTPYVANLTWTQYELQNFIQSLKRDHHLSSFVDLVCRRSASHPQDRLFHVFATGMLLESLTLDKLHMLHPHILFYKALHHPLPPAPHAFTLSDLALATAFYHHEFFPDNSLAGTTALITTNTLASIQHAQRVAIEELRGTTALRQMVQRYTQGENLPESNLKLSEEAWDIFAAYLVGEGMPAPAVVRELRQAADESRVRDSESVARLLVHMASARLQGYDKPAWKHASLSDIFSSWTAAP